MPRNVLLFLSQTTSYPTKLAQRIGCVSATLWYHLYKTHGEIKFEYSDPIALGILDGKKEYADLVNLGYLKEHEGQYNCSLDRIIALCDTSFLGEISAPFADTVFLKLLSDYERFVKERKGVVDKREVYLKFKDKSLEESIHALKYSLDNKFITLYFHAKDKRYTKKDGGRGRVTSSGGEQNKGREVGYESTDI